MKVKDLVKHKFGENKEIGIIISCNEPGWCIVYWICGIQRCSKKFLEKISL